MAGGGSAVWKKLDKAGREAYKAGLHLKAAGFYREARRVAEVNRDERRRVNSLFWEGSSLYSGGEPDAALPLLLQAAETTSPEADPADVYTAMTQAIEIAHTRKPASFVRKLISDAWLHLERLGKERWGHMLSFIEGRLAFAQGDYESALRAQRRAWDIDTGNYPAFTRATYLFRLCQCCFALRDRQELAKWVDAIEANRPEIEEDRIRASEGRLFLLRASDDRQSSQATAAEIARSVLRRLDAAEIADRLGALRALAVFGSHNEVERQVEELQPSENGDLFALHLLRGDFALCRARAGLGMEPRDDEWDEHFPSPSPPFPDREGALRHLRDAEARFEEARPIACQEDERLETNHYTRTLDTRLERARALRQTVETAPIESAP